MIKELFLKLLLCLLVAFSLFFLFANKENIVLAAVPCTPATEGITQFCDTCGVQICECSFFDSIFFLCDWGVCEETPRPEEATTTSWTEYRCEGTNLGDDILSRDCEGDCTRTCTCSGASWDCPDWDCSTSCGGASVYEDCKALDICSNGTSWGTSIPSCEFKSCDLEALSNPSPANGAVDILLPVILSWDEVAGADSYYYKIEEVEAVAGDFENSYANYANRPVDYHTTIRLASPDRINLNFGYVEDGSSPGLYNMDYSAPGYGCHFENVDSSIIYRMADGIESTANKNIDYLQKYQDYIEAGYCVGECVNTLFMVQPECYGLAPSVEDACEKFQGGFTGHIWTIGEIEARKEPYYKMLEDVAKIRGFVPEPPPEDGVGPGPPPEAFEAGLEGIITETEIILPPCSLKPETTYTWTVKACCNAEGTLCGAESNWSFTTSAAPEPLSPYDPDFAGPEQAEDIPLPVTLRWCAFQGEPKIYKLLFYIIEDEIEKCHPWLEAEGECVSKKVPFINEFPDLNWGYFSKRSSYAWQVAACTEIEETGEEQCSEYGQKWSFSTADYELVPPILIYPPNDTDTPVGLPVTLKWQGVFPAHSFIYELTGIETGTTKVTTVSFDYPKLNLDTVYSWRVIPCWDFEGTDCENWSETSFFRTTGRPPKLINPLDGTSNIPIPTTLKWEAVPGAISYVLNIGGGDLDLTTTTKKTEFPLDYPQLKQLTTYSWQARTCARANGELCGDWSGISSFTTFKLSAPTNPSPAENEEISTYQMPRTFSWDPVPWSKYYRYEIDYISKSPEEAGECPLGQVVGNIVAKTSVLVTLNCLGKYRWRVQACLDENCQEAGDWSPFWEFPFSQLAPPTEKGIVPCGRIFDNPDTSWNERDPCQLKHLFLMLKIILDFLLWRVSLIILVLLTLLTGVIFYFSRGAPETIVQIKSIWKAAGIGYGVIFFAWLIVTWLVSIVGFRVEIFGRWWELPF